MSDVLSVADGALARLAAALVQADDPFTAECTAEAVIDQLSPHDRKVVANIVRRVAELERAMGWHAAEAALADVLALLSRERAGVC